MKRSTSLIIDLNPDYLLGNNPCKYKNYNTTNVQKSCPSIKDSPDPDAGAGGPVGVRP